MQAERGMLLVADAHDFTAAVGGVGPGRDFQIRRKGAGLDHKAMVTSGFKRIGQALIQIAIVVEDAIDLAVHEALGANDLTTSGLADRLMTQADAEDR